MIVRQNKPFEYGFTSITQQHLQYPEMLLDFGILKLKSGEMKTFTIGRERAFLLIAGSATFLWEGSSATVTRNSCFDEAPFVLHVSKNTEVSIKTDSDCEICVEQVDNKNIFEAKLYTPEDTRTDIFGAGTLNETSIRSVRTVFDGEINPLSNMVLGEVINHPGKWSSYPPHDHPQPEIYHYRFFPPQGFGISVLDHEAHVVKNGDTTLIGPDKTHSQGAAPGYAMYYIWMIPHLPDDRWLPTTRYYRNEHKWLLEPGVKIWPERQ